MIPCLTKNWSGWSRPDTGQAQIVCRTSTWNHPRKATRYLWAPRRKTLSQEGWSARSRPWDYRPGKQASFKVFMEFQEPLIISCHQSATQKHCPLNCYVPGQTSLWGKGRTDASGHAGRQPEDPENLLVGSEAFNDIERNVSPCSVTWMGGPVNIWKAKATSRLPRTHRPPNYRHRLQGVKRNWKYSWPAGTKELDPMTLNKGLLIMAAKEHLRTTGKRMIELKQSDNLFAGSRRKQFAGILPSMKSTLYQEWKTTGHKEGDTHESNGRIFETGGSCTGQKKKSWSLPETRQRQKQPLQKPAKLDYGHRVTDLTEEFLKPRPSANGRAPADEELAGHRGDAWSRWTGWILNQPTYLTSKH